MKKRQILKNLIILGLILSLFTPVIASASEGITGDNIPGIETVSTDSENDQINNATEGKNLKAEIYTDDSFTELDTEDETIIQIRNDLESAPYVKAYKAEEKEREDAILSYGLQFFDESGSEYSPEGDIEITISSPSIEKATGESKEISVLYINNAGEEQKVTNAAIKGDSVTFHAENIKKIEICVINTEDDTEEQGDVKKVESNKPEQNNAGEGNRSNETNPLSTFKGPRSGIRLLSDSGTTPAETYNIVVNYIFSDNSIAQNPFVAMVNAGDNFDQTITVPTLPGYEAYYQDAPITTIHLQYSNLQENQTVYVQYRPIEVNYQVRHYWQNADNDNYTLHETETLTGYTGDPAVATPKAYQGFAALAHEEPAIAADGSTVIEIYYDREYSLIRFNLNGGYGVDPIYAKWGSSLSIMNPSRSGYNFAGWDKQIPATMPYGGDTFTATWTPIGSEYTVIYWLQNAEDDNYSFLGTTTKTAQTGSYQDGYDSIPGSISGEPSSINYSYTPVGSQAVTSSSTETVWTTQYTFTETTSTTSNTAYYIVENGEFVSRTLYYNNGTWYRSRSGNAWTGYNYSNPYYGTRYTRSTTGSRYTGARYTRSGNSAPYTYTETTGTSGTQYGVVGEGHVRVTSSQATVNHYEMTWNSGNSYVPTYSYWYQNGNTYAAATYNNGLFYNAAGNEITGTIYYRTAEEASAHPDWMVYNDSLTDKDVYIKGDNTSIINVYYDRAEYDITLVADGVLYTSNNKATRATGNTLTTLNNNYPNPTQGLIGASGNTKYVYYNGYWYRYSGSKATGQTEPEIHTISGRYGQNILSQWSFTGNDGNVYPTAGKSWYPIFSDVYTERLYNTQMMPAENSVFRLYSSTNSQKTYYYYVEAAPGDTSGIHRTYDGTDYVLHYTLNHDFNYFTRAEDFYDIDGFVQYRIVTSSGTVVTGNRYPTSGNMSAGEALYLYYSRDKYAISYQSNGETLTEDAEGASLTSPTYTQIPYESSLSNYEITPPYPDNFAIGAYAFAGWYDNADFAGEPFDFTAEKMPTSNLILFAKWVPIEQTVHLYIDRTKAEEGGEPIATYTVDYDSVIDPPPDPEPEHSEYVFIGWFYEENGTEKPFTFGAMPVHGNMDIYAKWSSSSIRPYNVYFQDEFGNDLAPPIHSSGYAGSTKTFDASPDVPAGYFPRVKSHSILIDIDGTNANGLNDFTFIYDHSSNVPYTVHYVDARTGESLLPDKVVSPNLDVRVTEKFRTIAGYVPDAFQKSLTISLTGTNEITFYYTRDSIHAFYLTSHYTEQADGTWSLYNALETWATIGDTATAVPLDIHGYNLDTSVAGTVQTGTVTADGLELKLYYLRNEYPYKVKYIDARTGLALHAEKTGTGKIDAQITEAAEDIAGYDCTNGPTKTITIQMEDDPTVPIRNVITFYYQVQQAQFNYTAGEGGTVDLSTEHVAAVHGTPQGAAATADNGYEFDGWYLDAAFTQPVTAAYATVSGTRITPVKQNGRYVNTNFYAKFRRTVIPINVSKRSYENNADVLSATYNIYKVNSSGTDQVTYNGTTYNVDTLPNLVLSGTTNELLVEPGTQYILQEATAPNGYESWPGKAMLTVANDGTITTSKEFALNLISYNSGELTLKDTIRIVAPSDLETNKSPYYLLILFGTLFLTIPVIARKRAKDKL